MTTRLAAALLLLAGSDAAAGIADEALGLARELDIPALTADVSHVCLGIGHRRDPRWRLRLASETVRRSARGSDLDVARSLHDRLLARIELGPRRDVDDAIAAFGAQARGSRAPAPWLAAVVEAAVVAARGEPDRAEQLAGAALELGQRSGVPDAAVVFGAQLLMVRWLQGRLAEIIDAVGEEARRRPQAFGWAAAWAMALAEEGDTVAAHAAIERLLPALEHGPQSPRWLAGVAVAASAVAAIGPPAANAARRLLRQLGPYAGRHLVLGPACVLYGPCDLFLGGLLAAAGATDEAAAAFARAADMADGAGLVPYAELARVGAVGVSGADGRRRRRVLAGARLQAQERGLVVVARHAARVEAAPGRGAGADHRTVIVHTA